MFEKVNPSHPDKIADRIAGAIVDLAYKENNNPKIAVEVLIGHGTCHIIIESNISLDSKEIDDIVCRIAGSGIDTTIIKVPQDKNLASNQEQQIKCGDNGIFKGAVKTREQIQLTNLVCRIYEYIPYDGKYILDNGSHLNNGSKKIIACQSNAESIQINQYIEKCLVENYKGCTIINPLGPWTGGIDVGFGATNRKLGSDMGDAVAGGGLHGKDLSKADVSLNIFAYLAVNEPNLIMEETGIWGGDMCDDLGYVNISCAIGQTNILCGEYLIPYDKIVDIARKYIKNIGGFERFAEWGLIRPDNCLL